MFHLDHEPQQWDEMYGQDLNVSKAKSWVSNNSHPSFIYIEGPTGCGKTAFSKLLIKATHCLNREDGESDPCGKCEVCRTDPISSGPEANVVWLTSSYSSDENAVSQQSLVKSAIAFANRGPIVTNDPDNEHREVLFVVFEEAHNIHKDLLQRVLAYGDLLDTSKGKVVFIFITMSPEEMPSMVRQALRQRGSTCFFPSPTVGQLEAYLMTVLKNRITVSTARILADYAEGSYRGALNAYKDCIEVNPDLNEALTHELFGLVTPEDRLYLWKEVIDGKGFSAIKTLVENHLRFTDRKKLIKQLLEDLDESLVKNECEPDDYFHAVKVLTTYLIHPELHPYQALAMLRGMKLINYQSYELRNGIRGNNA